MAVRGALLAAVALLLASAAAARPAPPTVLHISSHLPSAAQVSIDGRAPVTAPGYGSVVAPITAGAHMLKISAPGVSYQEGLKLDPANLMRWHGRAYWCVNLLESQLEPYSRSDCREDVTDAG
ncbi:MAG: hypothetical protein ACHP84_20355 [Caulobacterales bacterium]